MAVHDRTRILFTNERFAELFGYAPDEVIGMRPETFLAGEDGAELVHAASDDDRVYESLGRHKNSTTFPIELYDCKLQPLGARRRLWQVRDITQRRKAETEIQELKQTLGQRNAELDAERARWQAAIQGVADEVWTCDRAARISVLNLSVSSETGPEALKVRSSEEFLAQAEILNIDGRTRPLTQMPVLRSLRGEILHGEEILRPRATGETYYRQFSSAPVRDASGQITGAVAIVRDITDRKRAEEELRALKNRLAIELAGMAWLHELSSRFVGLNDLHPLLNDILNAAIEITGAEMGSLQLVDLMTGAWRIEVHRGLAHSFLDFLRSAERTREDTPAAYRDLLRQPERVVLEDLLRDSGGIGQRAVEMMLSAGVRALQCTPLSSREGRLVGNLTTYYPLPRRPNERDLRLLDLLGRQAADLIERALAQQALRQSEERLRLAAEVTGFGTFDVRPLAGEVFWSPELKTIMGVPMDHLPERSIPAEDVALIYPSDRERVAHKLAAAYDPGGDGKFDEEYRIVRPDGTLRWVLMKARVFFEDSGAQSGPVRISGAVLDITERKLAEAALIRSEKFASAGRMAASVAHEINNPLSAIMNAVFLASADPSLSERARAKLELAQRELNRVAHLTRQTLGFYRDTSSATLFRLGDLVDGVVELYEPKLQSKSIQLVRRYAIDDSVFAAAGAVRQIVSNLLANAIDAVSSGGQILVRTRKARTPHPVPNGVRFTIADNGVGMTPAELAKAFEPFFTTKESSGTGLGLWVTRELISRSQGKIRIRSRPGRGTVFRLSFPGAPQASKQASESVSPAAEVA